MASFWKWVGRIADTIAVASVIIDAVTALLKREHVTKLARDETLLIAVLGVMVAAGMIFVVSGFRIRLDILRPDRGRAGTWLMRAGGALLVGALVVFLLAR
jgi:heme A synthase